MWSWQIKEQEKERIISGHMGRANIHNANDNSQGPSLMVSEVQTITPHIQMCFTKLGHGDYLGCESN